MQNQTGKQEGPGGWLPLDLIQNQALGQKAWAVFADNGNVRMWATSLPPIQEFADAQGLNVTPMPVIVMPEHLDVRRIILDIVPGEGSGHEVHAKSVEDVEAAMTKMAERIEELESSDTMKQALSAYKALREWIEAVPEDVVARLPTMPGCDGDWLDRVEQMMESAIGKNPASGKRFDGETFPSKSSSLALAQSAKPVEEASKLAAEFDMRFESMNGIDVPARVSVPRDEWRSLYASLKRAFSQSTIAQDGDDDLMARGMGWQECVALMKEACEQAGVAWRDETKPPSIAVNVMQRLANSAHKAGFNLALAKLAAAQSVGYVDVIKGEYVGVISGEVGMGDLLYTTAAAPSQPVSREAVLQALINGPHSINNESITLQRDPGQGTGVALTQKDALGFEDALKIAMGCTDYSGGHRDNAANLAIYHHGIETVVNALQAALKNGLKSLSVAVLHEIGNEAAKPTKGEGTL